jgi:hypothetical protein
MHVRNLAPLFAAAITSRHAAARDHFEIVIGRSSAGQLAVHADFPQPIGLPPSIFPGFPGYAAPLPGCASLDFDEPGEDLYMLSPACNPVFILVHADPGIVVWNDTGSAPMTLGQSFLLGPPPFDTHPMWQIAAAEPGRVYTLQVRIHDNAGIYTDSEVVEFAFIADCYANCDASAAAPFLNVNDFTCFLNRFAAGDSYANCDGSTAIPVLNVTDFICFLNSFAAGCP